MSSNPFLASVRVDFSLMWIASGLATICSESEESSNASCRHHLRVNAVQCLFDGRPEEIPGSEAAYNDGVLRIRAAANGPGWSR